MDDPLSNNSIPFINAEHAAGQRVLGTQLPAHEPAATHSPHIVIRGESNLTDITPPKSLTLIDWASFTLKYDSLASSLDYLETLLENLFFISPVEWKPAKTGFHGYKNRILLGTSGFIAYGGASQNNSMYVSLPGERCRNVVDWKTFSLIGEEEGWRITRSDLAHDDFEGKSIDIAKALQWYDEGLFTNSGRPPKPHLHDDLDTGSGKTFELGSRKNGKFLRIYEKGKQLGNPLSEWVRAELQLGGKDRVIPWDVFSEPNKYLAGAYKAFQFLSQEQSRIETIQREATTKYESMVNWLRLVGGKALNTMLEVNGGDVSAVFEQIIRDGYPSRLSDLSDYLPAAVVKDQ